VYPNPITNRALFEYKNFNAKPYAIRILDTKGMVVFERQKITNSKTIFERKEISAGVYFVEIIDEVVLRRKLIVK
ncbi:MAG TPA: T9SS type A sorting domain-containing protein, partial [Flavobacteriales bacterium]|nr:T9SS type A sorting domain-containing protein [Flavobacteriales bacterium]